MELGLLWSRVQTIHAGTLTLGAGWVEQRLDGVSIAGVGTVAGQLRGVMVAGGNWTRGSMQGAQLGLVNLAQGQGVGAQIALGNVTQGGFDGSQVGLVNVATGTVRGAQVGLVNWAGDVEGTQIGLLNVGGKVRGYPVGPFNFNETGRMSVLGWWSSAMLTNMAIRYLHRFFYTQVGLAWRPDDPDMKGYDRIGWQVALGGHVAHGQVFLDADAGYSHEGATGTDTGVDHVHVATYRVAAGWQPTRVLSIFAGGGLRHIFETGTHSRVAGEGLAGIQLF